ncbi:hypothetical protein FD723_40855 (plasmid) [Nostoc sp. C052]|uniref:hypothetical protein n=1 Tax=Nostoc sp. C052 TaxID=2576902 RepID=UPI0015C30E2C|nr:hypothetical protein [Nostoc sp. C052]QLE46566.1 hypothetical protein FD723_40855 [Nostoc sp. C052]
MSKQGFNQIPTDEAVPNSSSEIDARAIDIGTLKYETFTLEDYNASNLPELPVGIFLTNAEGVESRLRTIKLRDNIDTGDFDLFLAELDPQEGDNPKKTVDTLSNFLGGGRAAKSGYHLGAVEAIGDIPVKELAQQLGYAETAKVFSGMYLGDVAALMFAVRLKTAGKDVAVDRTCPIPQCQERCRSIENLDPIKVKSFPDLTKKPLFKLVLPRGIVTPKAKINNLYLEPLKLHQLGLFLGGGTVPDVEMLKAMVAEIPEIDFGGTKKVRPFTNELYRSMTQEDIYAFREAIAQIQPGPTAVLPVICNCGQEEFQHQLNWARMPREFLYKTQKLLTIDN